MGGLAAFRRVSIIAALLRAGGVRGGAGRRPRRGRRAHIGLQGTLAWQGLAGRTIAVGARKPGEGLTTSPSSPPSVSEPDVASSAAVGWAPAMREVVLAILGES
jgi:hypothetical protein